VTAIVVQSPSIVGLILTGKSIARFPELKERFAEYFLIGTLLSIGLAGSRRIGARKTLVRDNILEMTDAIAPKWHGAALAEIRASKPVGVTPTGMLCRRSTQLAVLICTWGVWLASPAMGSPQKPSEQHATLQLISEQDAFVPGKELWVALRFTLDDGWHTYWLNPGDSGEAPRIDWHLPGGFQAGQIQWPYPTRLLNPPFADYGYKHELLLMTALSTPAPRPGETVKIGANVHYLICREVCIPGKKELEMTLPVRNHAAPAAAAALFRVAREKLPRPEPGAWRVAATSFKDEFVVDLPLAKPAMAPEFFPLEEEQIENAAPQRVSAKPGGIRLHLMKSKHLREPVSHLKGVLVVGPGRAYVIDVPLSRSLSRAHRQSARN
jgi:DsbC/DsbD-like thiol-disulfide interchange protein